MHCRDNYVCCKDYSSVVDINLSIEGILAIEEIIIPL